MYSDKKGWFSGSISSLIEYHKISIIDLFVTNNMSSQGISFLVNRLKYMKFMVIETPVFIFIEL